MLVGIGLLLPGYALFALMPTPALALLLLIPATLGAAIPTSAGAAALMLIAPPRMRAQVSALFYFVINLVGLGVGPTAVALLTDYVFRDEAALRYSLALVALSAGVEAIITLALVLAPYRRTLAQAQHWAAALDPA